MNPDIKEKWVKKLRSGEFKQGKDQLKKHSQERVLHCCLGVLCEIYLEENTNAKWDNYKFIITTDDEVKFESGVLPQRVVEWAGLKSSNPVVFYGARKDTLSEFNDEGIDFNIISNLIEEQL